MAQPIVRSERAVIFLLASVQFVNILDFMMVNPLGPDFARALGIPEEHLGYIVGSYAASGSLTGLLGALFLDRFDRRTALGGAMLGLVLATAAGGFAQGLPSLMAARLAAGAFGGPATSLAISILSDVIPNERRGKAMGAMAGAFSVASVLGVPAGLWLAEQSTWRTPFFAVASLGFVVSAAAVFFLPPMRGHLSRAQVGGTLTSTGALLRRRTVQVSLLLTAVVMMAGFMVVPNLAAYVQGNLGYPREGLKWLYLAGGAVSFFSMRLTGRVVDRFGSFRVGVVGTVAVLCVYYFFLYAPPRPAPVMLFFVGFMAAMSIRNISYNTLTTKVPRPFERARFQSIQSAVQHAASASGAFLSARLLHADAGSGLSLEGMPRVAAVSMALTCFIPVMLSWVERRVVDDA